MKSSAARAQSPAPPQGKPHWRTLPAQKLAKIEQQLERGEIVEAVQEIFRADHDISPQEVRALMLATARLAELSSTGDHRRIAEYRSANSIRLADEARAHALSVGRRHWAAQPFVDQAATALAEHRRLAEERETYIERRAKELLAFEDAERLRLARARAGVEFDERLRFGRSS